MTEELADLRPIHYMGNKSRFLNAIQAAVETVASPGTAACDLFAGTGVVTRRLAQKRRVISADIQAYSAILSTALTSPRTLPQAERLRLRERAQEWIADTQPAARELLAIEESALQEAATSPARLAELVERGSLALTNGASTQLEDAKDAARGSLDPQRATLTWYYGGVYFSYQQALELDALRYACRALWGQERDQTVVAALLGAASDTVSTVGNHFAQPVQPRRPDGSLKRTWVAAMARRRRLSATGTFETWLERYAWLPATPFTCTAIQSDFRDTLSALGPEVGAIYADPPYTRDHYSRFYHVLETIAADDDPGCTLAHGSAEPGRGLYRKTRHQSPFSIRSQAGGAFQELFSHAKRLDVPLVLSYSPMSAGTAARPQTRLMDVQAIIQLAGESFNNIRTLDVATSRHSRFNKTELNVAIEGAAEVLIVATN